MSQHTQTEPDDAVGSPVERRVRCRFCTRYRVVRDGYLGFEVQAWRWWLPIWLQVGINTHTSEAAAIAFAERHAKRVVRNIGAI